MSKYYDKEPYHFEIDGETLVIKYLPGESDSGMFGGNSNWYSRSDAFSLN